MDPFNPLDGKGVRNENVTEYRYALVESDSMEIGKQHALIRELELPVACLLHSGRKSLHAIVRIDAADYGEYPGGWITCMTSAAGTA